MPLAHAQPACAVRYHYMIISDSAVPRWTIVRGLFARDRSRHLADARRTLPGRRGPQGPADPACSRRPAACSWNDSCSSTARYGYDVPAVVVEPYFALADVSEVTCVRGTVTAGGSPVDWRESVHLPTSRTAKGLAHRRGGRATSPARPRGDGDAARHFTDCRPQALRPRPLTAVSHARTAVFLRQ